MTSDESLAGAGAHGTILDGDGNPLSEIKVSARSGDAIVEVRTDQEGAFFLRLPNPGTYVITIGNDTGSGLELSLKEHDLAIMEWQEQSRTLQTSLPLAEIRTVDIVLSEGPAFNAVTPWASARFRWSVSGGALVKAGDQVVWEPPTKPGRYLLQVIADWGRTGMAVDSVVLVLDEDGSIFVS